MQIEWTIRAEVPDNKVAGLLANALYEVVGLVAPDFEIEGLTTRQSNQANRAYDGNGTRYEWSDTGEKP